MNIFPKLAVAITGFALSCAAIETKQVQAATVTDYFTVDVTSGALVGHTGRGSFSYDDSPLSGKGLETVDVQSLSFNFLGKVYTQNDNYFSEDGLPPTLDLNNGSVVGLNYAVNYKPDASGGFGRFFYIAGSPDLTDVTGGATFYEGVPEDFELSAAGTVTYVTANSVPEPTSTWGTLAFGALGAGSLLLRQMKKRSLTA